MVDSTSQALAAMLLDSSGAMAWIAWVKRKALETGALVEDPATGRLEPRPAIEPPPRRVPAASDAGPEPAAEPELEGVVLSAAEARKAARNAAYRATPEAAMFRAFSGG
jgi:hypothetical protein